MDGLEVRIILALVLSAAIGLERQSYVEQIDRKQKYHHGVIGVRTHSLIGILGVVTGLTILNYPAISALMGIGFLSLLIAYYLHDSRQTGDYGPTSELNMLWCFGMSTLLSSGIVSPQIVVSLVACGLLIMSTKNKVHSLVDNIRWHHIQQLILFGMIALVVLPYLPNTSITLKHIPYLQYFFTAFQIDISKWLSLEIVNPYTIWRVVVLITGVEIVAFLLQQWFGRQKGWVVAYLVGGFISSTSTTISIASSYRKNKLLDQSVAGILLANIASFVPMLGLVVVTNVIFFREVFTTILALFISGSILSIYFVIRARSHSITSQSETIDEMQDIFSLWPAIKFALIFCVVKIVTKVAFILLGDAGFVIGSTIAGVSGMDAVTINSAQLAGDTISYGLATLSMVTANSMNFFAKAVYTSLTGDRKLGIYVGSCFAVMTLCMCMVYWLF
jgi:uncharacterized membrane protein (DUF4010 family)